MFNRDLEQLFRETVPVCLRRRDADRIPRPKLVHQLGESASLSPMIKAETRKWRLLMNHNRLL